MVKINKNSVIGISSLAVFMIFGIVGISGGVLKYVLFGFLHVILAAATFVLMGFAVEGNGKGLRDSNYFWCDLAPFAIILVIAKIVAGWDFYIVFYFLGMIFLTLNETLKRLDNGADLFTCGAELFPQALNVGVHCPDISVIFVTPTFEQKLFSGQNCVPILHQAM